MSHKQLCFIGGLKSFISFGIRFIPTIKDINNNSKIKLQDIKEHNKIYFKTD